MIVQTHFWGVSWPQTRGQIRTGLPQGFIRRCHVCFFLCGRGSKGEERIWDWSTMACLCLDGPGFYLHVGGERCCFMFLKYKVGRFLIICLWANTKTYKKQLAASLSCPLFFCSWITLWIICWPRQKWLGSEQKLDLWEMKETIASAKNRKNYEKLPKIKSNKNHPFAKAINPSGSKYQN